MPKVHVFIPFSRNYLTTALSLAYYPMGVTLHPITMEGQEDMGWVENELVKPFVVPSCSHSAIANHKVNYFLRHAPIEDNDYYVWMNDDDMMELGVAEAVSKMDNPVVFVSMKRGLRMPPPTDNPMQRHPIYTLYAHPDNVKLCGISAEQMFIKGKIYRELQFHRDHPWADGFMAIALKELLPIRYEPELFILFNYYEPGRW